METCNLKTLKKYTIGGAIFVMIVGTLSHFLYEWSGYNPLVGLFTPVNESTWEHMKLLFFPMLLFALLFARKPCMNPALPCAILFGTGMIPVLFYTCSGILGKNYAPIDIAIFFISVAAAFFLLYRQAKDCKKTPCQVLPWLGVGLLAICFFLFSYAPPNLGIFAIP
jgi:peptidoglycan/LPS O-acetylase OafA/YrhL